MLQRGPGWVRTASMSITFRDCELDLRQHELRRAGSVVHVEPQVFDLLVLLMKNRDRIVSRDEIIEVIWNGRIVSEAALSSRINAARKAVGDSGNEQAVIRTFHKRGFRFVADAKEDDAPAGHEPSEPGGVADSVTARSELSAIAADAALHLPSVAVLPFVNV